MEALQIAFLMNRHQKLGAEKLLAEEIASPPAIPKPEAYKKKDKWWKHATLERNN